MYYLKQQMKSPSTEKCLNYVWSKQGSQIWKGREKGVNVEFLQNIGLLKLVKLLE